MFASVSGLISFGPVAGSGSVGANTANRTLRLPTGSKSIDWPRWTNRPRGCVAHCFMNILRFLTLPCGSCNIQFVIHRSCLLNVLYSRHSDLQTNALPVHYFQIENNTSEMPFADNVYDWSNCPTSYCDLFLNVNAFGEAGNASSCMQFSSLTKCIMQSAESGC